MLGAVVINLRAEPVKNTFTVFFTRLVCTIFSAAFVNDQSTLEELKEAWRLFPLTHQHLNSQSDTH